MEPSNTKLVECFALKILHSSPPSLKDPKKTYPSEQHFMMNLTKCVIKAIIQPHQNINNP
jgi:hypothetical protein